MNKLVQKIEKDEKARVYKDSLYQEAVLILMLKQADMTTLIQLWKTVLLMSSSKEAISKWVLILAKLKLLNKERTNQNINWGIELDW